MTSEKAKELKDRIRQQLVESMKNGDALNVEEIEMLLKHL